MNKHMLSFVTGIALGVVLGFTKEEEIDDLCHQAKKSRRKMMKKINSTCDFLERK